MCVHVGPVEGPYKKSGILKGVQNAGCKQFQPLHGILMHTLPQFHYRPCQVPDFEASKYMISNGPDLRTTMVKMARTLDTNFKRHVAAVVATGLTKTETVSR